MSSGTLVNFSDVTFLALHCDLGMSFQLDVSSLGPRCVALLFTFIYAYFVLRNPTPGDIFCRICGSSARAAIKTFSLLQGVPKRCVHFIMLLYTLFSAVNIKRNAFNNRFLKKK